MSGRSFGAALAFLAALFAWPGWTRPLADPDLFWLLRAGDALLSGVPLRANAWSFTAPEHPWRLHEPLVAMAYAAVGIEGVGWVRGVVLTALAAALLTLAGRARSGWSAVLGLAWAYPGLSVALSERAMAWGDALFAWTLVLVLGEVGSRRLWAATALVVLGSGVHGSFVLGLVVLGLASWRHGLLAALGTLASPAGRESWSLIVDYALGRGPTRVVHAYILEWTPLWPDDLAWGLRLVALVLGLGLALSAARGRWRALVLGLAALALWHRRSCDVFALGALPFVVLALDARLPARDLRGAGWGFAALVLPVALFAPRVGLDPQRYPPEIATQLEPTERTFSDIELGAWLASEGVPVFWDARNDCYPASVLEDGARVALLSPGWESVLVRHGVTRVLTRDPRLQGALVAAGAREQARSGALALLRLPSPASTDSLR